ncbi:AAA family ATPase [Massilia sp. CF038]|uniref:AAA family ATPase n=1 Tax=Massilia sp. CF038 TaxID=1881045 RepID=UPI0009247D66|nr:AAA family ATPase [Massilia sp. CF038]SHH04092.1 Predicted ATPase [Massilia sp. CF038]
MIQALPGYTVAQLLRDDPQFVLLRALRDADGAPVLVLVARDGSAEACLRIENEYALRGELDAAWAALPLELVRSSATLALVLADDGVTPLTPLPAQALPTAPFVRLASAMAAALVQMHRRQLVHHDLRPEHVLIDAAGSVRLCGFGLAGPLAMPAAALAALAAPHPDYMSPEQGGRMDRPVDYRSDLYALGVILYRLLCGVLPFEAGPGHSLACHVARLPTPPDQVLPGVDPACAAIVQKLLAKCPSERYQSALGLHADLLHCADMVQAHGRADAFPLGCNDGAARLQTPARLIGRAAQLGVLEEAALHVGAGGTPELVMVSGNAGTGKSALLAALQQSEAVAGAIVVAARFEQHQRGVPYATLAQAFQKLVRQLLGQSEAALVNWRRVLQQALGGNAGLMLEMIPELKFVLGPQPAPPPVAAVEAEGRLQAVFRQFLGAFTGADSMLLLCLDDLQWIDPASLKLLTHLVSHPDVRHMLVVGAFRESDVGAAHPLALLHERLRRQGASVRRIELPPLSKTDSGELVAAALGSDCTPLASLVFAKTGGNPFFTLQFLARLVESGLLHFEHASGQWEWDAQAIRAREFSDNVVDLMIARLQQLPYGTLELVKLLACLGQDAPLEMIAQAAGMTALETDEGLWPAARLGLVARGAGAYCFVHDRVQEAAYSLMARASLPERHLHIGRLLLGTRDSADLGEDVYAVVGHLNRAREVITDGAELARLVALNALAGARSRRAIAFDAARHYYEQAVNLTPATSWQDDGAATFALFSELAECEYLCGNLERADRLFGELSVHASSRLALARVALMRVALYQVWGRFDLAAAVAVEALALFGIHFPDGSSAIAESLAAEQSAVQKHMAGRAIADLEHEAPSADPELAIVSELLSDMGSSVFSARPELYSLLAVKALNFTLRFGSTATSCMTYSRYAILLVSLGAIPDAFAFSELALRLAERDGAGARRRGRLAFVHAAYVHCWRQPIEATVALLEQAHISCQEAGDLPHAGYAAHVAVWNSFEAGAALGEVQQRARKYQDFARQQNNEVLMQLLRCYEQLTLCLQGATGVPGEFDDEHFCAAEALALMDRANYGAARPRFHLMRQIAAFTFGRFDEALQAADAASADQYFFLASVNEATHHFYHALTMAALYPDAPRERQVRFMAALQDKQDRLRAWAAHCPANFDNRYLLVAAEMARIQGRDMEAMRAYDGALASARASGFVQHEALAAELAAAFYRQRGFDKIAVTYARDALTAYGRWGAYAKMRELEGQYPGLVRVPSPGAQAVAGGPVLDLMAALRASQALSGTLESGALGAQLLRSAIELTGAARALLILPRADGYGCVAQAELEAGTVRVAAAQLSLEAAPLPLQLLHFVLRTRETVLVDDAQESAQFRDDPMIRAARLRSVLCVPLLRRGVLVGALYLDNNLAPGVFTAARVLMLELLAAQGAISLGNANVLELLGRENATYRAMEAASARKAAYLCAMNEDMRTPVGAIAALAALAERSGQDQHDALAKIGQGAQSLLQMMNDVLDHSQIEAGTLQFESLVFSPAELAAQVHAAAAARAAGHQLQCRLELDPALPRSVTGDPLRIGQVWFNLLDNALLQTGTGHVGLALAMEAQEGGVARLRFCVSSGPFSAAHTEALFAPYSQAAQAQARAQGGSGLGLAIAQALVKGMGGHITVQANALQFTLALACVADPASARHISHGTVNAP